MSMNLKTLDSIVKVEVLLTPEEMIELKGHLFKIEESQTVVEVKIYRRMIRMLIEKALARKK